MHFCCTLKASRYEFMGYGYISSVEIGQESSQRSPSAIILSALASEMPLIAVNTFFGVYATDSTVCKPASVSFLQS